MSFEITNVAGAHIPQILELERRCFSTPWHESTLRMQMERHIFLAALAGAVVLGYAGCMRVLDEGYISNVAVAPEYRRQGVADALLDALEARGRAERLAFLTLEVRESNAPAVALYEKHGFKAVGRRKKYYEKPVEDALLMTLEF